MPTTLDALEARRSEALRHYNSLVGDASCCDKVALHISWLETELDGIYKFTRERTKGDLSVRDIHTLWAKTAEIFDFFIEYVRGIGVQSRCPVSYDRLLALHRAASDKADFHACCH